jgi:hypothetical protein
VNEPPIAIASVIDKSKNDDVRALNQRRAEDDRRLRSSSAMVSASAASSTPVDGDGDGDGDGVETATVDDDIGAIIRRELAAPSPKRCFFPPSSTKLARPSPSSSMLEMRFSGSLVNARRTRALNPGGRLALWPWPPVRGFGSSETIAAATAGIDSPSNGGRPEMIS